MPAPRLPVLLALPALLAAAPAEWPREVRTPPVKTEVTLEVASGNTLIVTPRYRIESETAINRPDLERFARVIESVPAALARLPLRLAAPPEGKPARILICRDEASFAQHGGDRGSVGVYDGRKREVLIRADYFLNPPRRRSTRLRARPNEDLLVHEFVHLNMHGILWRIPPWFSEGTADYFAAAHQGAGHYTFHDIDTSIRDRIRGYVEHGGDGTLALPPVGFVLGLDPAGWKAASNDPRHGNRYLPYATALLLAHYHFHGGHDRRTTTGAWLESLHGLNPRAPTPPFPAEDAERIEARLKKFWTPRGLNLHFVPASERSEPGARSPFDDP